jgi:two-component system cell cycle sensor histidine kinase/response regulator CckA
MASRIGYKFYGFLFCLLVGGMSLAGYVHQIDNWLVSILVVVATFPTIFLFVKQEHEKMEALYQKELGLKNLSLLAGGVAHDFNNILSVVIGNLELALLETPEDHPSRELIIDGFYASQRAALLSGQLLSFSGRKPGGRSILDFRSEVLTICGLTLSMIPKGIHFDLDGVKSSCFIEADEAEIQQVLMSILVNASEASVAPAEIKVELSVDEVNNRIVLFVKDQGIGISKDRLEDIFIPFESTKESGHGLGLAMAKKVLESHGGSIEIISLEDKGTTVKVQLPAVNPTNSILESDAAGWEPQTHCHEGLVLIIDDEREIRKIARKYLEQLGYSVQEASSADEGIGLFKENLGLVKVVLLDLKMPDKDGWQCLSELREIDSNFPVVISSGFNPDEHRSDVSSAVYLPKPYSQIELEKAFRSAHCLV